MKIVNLVSCSLLFSFAACATTGDEDTSSTSDELLGAPVDHHNKWSVGVCAGPLNQDPAAGPIGACLTSGTRCTGSLVARDVVMTARHCVHEIDYSNATSFCTGVFTTTPLSDAGVRVTTDLSVLGANIEWTKVAEVIVPPAIDGSCAGDIAFLRLAHPIAASDARPVSVDVRELTTHQPNRVAVVGRGVIAQLFDTTDYSVISEDEGGLKRRVRQNIDFECVSNTFGDCVAEDIGAPFEVDTGYAQFASSTASGDSGSGVARQWSFAAHNPVLIGVTSAGTVDPVTGIPNHSFLTRLDQHRAFIKSTLRFARGANVID
ncbi:MAG: trypsin-like serine protease [Kofleriaceae bacterium]|nr:trypsin-like serine protease [Kofleriaceae bacterium]